MLEVGVQTRNIVRDDDPAAGFRMIRRAGFTCADFNLNDYLRNDVLYKFKLNHFFDRSRQELEDFFKPHREGAKAAGVTINQMHMPYPIYVPDAGDRINRYLANIMAPKSLEICAFFGCRYIVVHGFKLARELGSEAAEWEWTEQFLLSIAPLAKELGVVLCVENLYDGGMEGPCCDAWKAAERLDRLNDRMGTEAFGFCFDTGHANMLGIDFEDFIITLGGRIKVLHIHDNNGGSDMHQIPFTFSATRKNLPTTDWDGFVRGLRSIRFNGVLNFETAPVLQAFPEQLKPDALALIAKIGAYFASTIEEGR